jgi:hypothetical protein
VHFGPALRDGSGPALLFLLIVDANSSRNHRMSVSSRLITLTLILGASVALSGAAQA